MSSQRSARFTRAKRKDREEAEHDAREHDLARRYFFGSPFHKDEIASLDHSEQGKSNSLAETVSAGHQLLKPRSMAKTIAWARVQTPSLSKRLET